MKARIPGANHQSQAAMMKQVQKMQEDMANLQADIEERAKGKGLSVNALIALLLQEDMNMTEDEWKRTTEE